MIREGKTAGQPIVHSACSCLLSFRSARFWRARNLLLPVPLQKQIPRATDRPFEMTVLFHYAPPAAEAVLLPSVASVSSVLKAFDGNVDAGIP